VKAADKPTKDIGRQCNLQEAGLPTGNHHHIQTLTTKPHHTYDSNIFAATTQNPITSQFQQTLNNATDDQIYMVDFENSKVLTRDNYSTTATCNSMTSQAQRTLNNQNFEELCVTEHLRPESETKDFDSPSTPVGTTQERAAKPFNSLSHATKHMKETPHDVIIDDKGKPFNSLSHAAKHMKETPQNVIIDDTCSSHETHTPHHITPPNNGTETIDLIDLFTVIPNPPPNPIESTALSTAEHKPPDDNTSTLLSKTTTTNNSPVLKTAINNVTEHNESPDAYVSQKRNTIQPPQAPDKLLPHPKTHHTIRHIWPKAKKPPDKIVSELPSTTPEIKKNQNDAAETDNNFIFKPPINSFSQVTACTTEESKSPDDKDISTTTVDSLPLKTVQQHNIITKHHKQNSLDTFAELKSDDQITPHALTTASNKLTTLHTCTQFQMVVTRTWFKKYIFMLFSTLFNVKSLIFNFSFLCLLHNFYLVHKRATLHKQYFLFSHNMPFQDF
jgi:hypothetical protein